jgi:uncharacterized membrane protein
MGGTKQQQGPAGRDRLDSVDRLRGLVMVLMALDHTRGYFARPFPDPTDLEHTTVALFLTRWISHLCAPTFLFLAGAGAYLAGRRGKTKPQLAWFLLTRGLWIVFLELTVVRLAWTFDPDLRGNNAGVLWAIGWSMVALAGLVFLPTWAVAAFGVIMIAGHNLLDDVNPAWFGPLSPLWEILHRKEMHHDDLILFGGGVKFGTQYPLIPWVGVMAAGYGFGSLLLRDAAARRWWLIGLGTALSLGFLLLRAANVYGDPDPWSPQRDGVFTVLSFLNCHKYPPSLCYLLMTLGPALLLLAFFERAPHAPGRPLLIFGRVPMFFYLIHIPLIHALALVAALARYGPVVFDPKQMMLASSAVSTVGLLGSPSGQGLFLAAAALFPGRTELIPVVYGYSLPVVYAIWLAVLLVLYPVCRWFAGVKGRRRDAWLSYI